MQHTITFIIGETGAGKTSLAKYFIQKAYRNEGRNILRKSCELVKKANRDYGRNYTLPEKVPIYTNFYVNLHVGYRRYYEPYFLNGYYFGVTNDKVDTEYVVPGSWLVLDEAQRILNSRKSSSFADHASYGFETSRQAELQIILIAQRGKLIDCNIRDLGVHVINVVNMDNDPDAAGNVVRSTWNCREFDGWQAAEKYFQTGEGQYKEKQYVYEGNIFKGYDSYEKVNEFLPPKGKDFDYLPHRKPEQLTAREEKFYKPGEPKEYRADPQGNNSKGRKRL